VIRDFVNKKKVGELLSGKDISNDDTVVLYGGDNNWFAVYVYWYFTLYGQGSVNLLDGGCKKWEQDQELSIRSFRGGALAVIGNKNLIDVRPPDARWARADIDSVGVDSNPGIIDLTP